MPDQSFPTQEIILAIDFGTERVGLAISRIGFALPLTILSNTPELYEQLKLVIESNAITQIVIGLSEGAMAAQTKQFAEQLAKHTTLPIEFADETLSSQVVRAKLKASKRAKPGQHIDHYAAAEFLQEWLDSREKK